ncbi:MULTISPECIES: DUF1697 domain-containing protein [unclassified Streptomyces]|uniref:DUF1697 domain-containing protein n=1 Tax=Streptomyces TaxID=1883 RepID=UPI00039E3A66|nr:MULTISPECIES: DUF1697 domain-containing protein [unclassified Streptomyces]MYR65523.1 DUF1697 domain-containing protein [Streptomyces sp. SID4939]MYS01843.1 DUF1697 domain-containing protein [Streptomyces sp. SID4940]MYT67407.1 DUF1697 domain-containing protein [Streptomyces sp. SID8357]MYT87907.1 DUF1697 domain-containing protein [Streptomyces sp. SID8360]MYU32183.1 DUF1697 domain-containing protein [Streptomyces sp. SID8358]
MSTRYAALLRGVNVSGHRRVPMAELRALLTELGHTDVATHLQSGNAVFSSASGDEDTLGAELERAVEEHVGFRVDVLVRTGRSLAAVADACPFPADRLEGRQLHVTFFDRPVEAARFASLDTAAFLPEEFRIGGRELYLYAPDGLGRSKLAVALGRPALNRGLVATSRNWNTVARLVEMTRD